MCVCEKFIFNYLGEFSYLMHMLGKNRLCLSHESISLYLYIVRCMYTILLSGNPFLYSFGSLNPTVP